MLNELELIARSQRGDLGAFNALVEAHQTQVYNLALRMVSDPHQAEDVAQDTFLSAFKNIRAFRGGNFRAWLLRIATNACHEVYRSRSRHKGASLDALTEAGEQVPARGQGSPEDRALQAELSEAIRRGLATLSEDLRLALVLVDVEGLSYEEAAQVMAAPVGTVKSRLSRARAQVRDHLLSLGELLPSSFRR